jgi:hypothetical protein
MTKRLRFMRLIAMGSVYGTLGTGVFSGCGDPAIQSQSAERSDATQQGSGTQGDSKLTGSGSSTGSNSDSKVTQAAPASAGMTGLRHSSADTEHTVVTANKAVGLASAHLSAPVSASQESIALCSDSAYSKESAQGGQKPQEEALSCP